MKFKFNFNLELCRSFLVKKNAYSYLQAELLNPNGKMHFKN